MVLHSARRCGEPGAIAIRKCFDFARSDQVEKMFLFLWVRLCGNSKRYFSMEIREPVFQKTWIWVTNLHPGLIADGLPGQMQSDQEDHVPRHAL